MSTPPSELEPSAPIRKIAARKTVARKAVAKKAVAKKTVATKKAEDPTTFEDVRAHALTAFDQLVKKGDRDHLHDRLVEVILGWAELAGDEEIRGWLDRLDGSPEGGPRRVFTAARIAVQRALAGDLESARGHLADAEAHRGKEHARWGNEWTELAGLIPAWWRLGDGAAADAAFQRLEAQLPRTRGWSSDSTCDLAELAALGGRGDIVARLAPRLRGSPHDPERYVADAEERMTSGMVALFADQDPGFGAVLEVWNGLPDRRCNRPLSYAVLTHCCRSGRPGAYLEAALRYPAVLWLDYARVSLMAVERLDPAAAVALAEKVLARAAPPFPRIQALAVLATHAPAVAAAWAASADGEQALSPSSDERFYVEESRERARTGYCAALGLRAEALADPSPLGASLMADRETARAILFAQARNTRGGLLMLDALGERARVDAELERTYQERAATDPKKRGGRAGHAGALGRIEVAFADRRLMAASTRHVSLGELAFAGAWGAILEELALRRGNSLFEDAFTTLCKEVFAREGQGRFDLRALWLPLRCDVAAPGA